MKQLKLGAEIAFFKEFRSAWTNIHKMDFITGIQDNMLVGELTDVAEGIVTFATQQLEVFQPRDDYKALLQLNINFLGGSIPRSAFSFKAPAGLHSARWMA